MGETQVHFPFSAVVGQDQLKLALILSAVSPGIGGVLIRGEKGTAKSTIVRGLGPLMAPAATDVDGEATHSRGRVVELPIGATEDRVVGSLNLTSVLRDGRAEFTPGLLAQADGGVLYIDEVNLLADHLVDVLLDAAASGRVTIERDGVSHTQSANFVLVGTMNPEEGELRPQLLDRFGLAVDVVGGKDIEERVEVITRRMAFDSDPEAFVAAYVDAEDALAERIAAARAAVTSVEVSTSELRRIAGICAHLDVDGLRGDIVVARAAAAHAAWRGASVVNETDVRAAVALALPHRRRRNPFDESGLSSEQLDDAMAAGDEAAGPPDDGPDGDGPDGAPPGGEAPDPGESPQPPADNDQTNAPAVVPGPRFGQAQAASGKRMRALRVQGIGDGEPGRRSRARSRRGQTTHAAEFRPGSPVHLFATVLNAASRRVLGAAGRTPRPALVTEGDLRAAQRVGQESNLVVFVVDLSGSMTARRRLAAVTELCVDLLRDSYTRRDRVAVVVACGTQASLVVPPTKSVDVAVARLAKVRTGGRTPLAEGLSMAADVIARSRRSEPERRPLLVVLSDGRATAGPDAAERARSAATQISRRGVDSVVVDCEQGMVRLHMAGDLAAHLGAELIPIAELSLSALAHRSRSAA